MALPAFSCQWAPTEKQAASDIELGLTFYDHDFYSIHDNHHNFWPDHHNFWPDHHGFLYGHHNFSHTNYSHWPFGRFGENDAFKDKDRFVAYCKLLFSIYEVQRNFDGAFNDAPSYWHKNRYDPDVPHPTPEPASFLLLGSGLIGLMAIRRRKRN